MGQQKILKSWMDGKRHVVPTDDVQAAPQEFAAQLHAYASEHGRTVHVSVEPDGAVALRFET